MNNRPSYTSNRTLFLTRISLLIAVTIVIQIAGFPQPVTGPLVNAMLFVTVQVLGLPAAITLGIITPAAALIRGQLPPVLAPMLPFIALGNILLAVVFSLFNRTGDSLPRIFRFKWYLALILSAAVKFGFLYGSVTVLLPLVFGHTLPAPVAVMMAFPQLLTALAGGIISGLLMKILKKIEKT